VHVILVFAVIFLEVFPGWRRTKWTPNNVIYSFFDELRSLFPFAFLCARAYARGGFGVKTPPWICYVTKTSLLMQRSLCTFSYIFCSFDVNL